MHHHLYHSFIRFLFSVLLLLMLSVVIPTQTAKANYFNDLYNGLQQFSELPGEVNKLQEGYQKTAEELEQTKNQLGQTISELGETKDQLGQTLESMESYRNQNAALMEQNRQLTMVVDQLRDERETRENYLDRIKITLYTGIALIIGYFVLVRFIRFSMRYRSSRGDRGGKY